MSKIQKVIWIIILCASIIVLSSCQKSTTNSSDKGNTVDSTTSLSTSSEVLRLQPTKSQGEEDVFTGNDHITNTRVSGFNGKEITFEATEQDIIAILGKPYQVLRMDGVTSLKYEDKSQSGSSQYCDINLIDNVLCLLKIENDLMEGPKGLKCGDSFAKAIRLLASPKQLELLGVSANSSDEKIVKQLALNPTFELTFVVDSQTRIELQGSEDRVIRGMTLFRSNPHDSLEIISEDDFRASPMEIVNKFGYPKSMFIEDGKAVIFYYSGGANTGEMRILNSSFEHYNSVRSSSWASEMGIKTGQTRSEVEKLVGGTLNEGAYRQVEFDFNQNTYALNANFYEGKLAAYTIWQVQTPNYPNAPKTPKKFTLPPFDANEIAGVNDIYLSELTLESSRRACYNRLGLPMKVISDYDDMLGINQDCTYKNGKVSFYGLVDNKDLNSGSAYYLSISDPEIIGPRGIRVGDPIRRVLDVFPGRNDIDFAGISENTAIYAMNSNDNTNSAWIRPDLERGIPISGSIHINIEWTAGIGIEYERGIITGIYLSQMMN